MAIVWVKDIRSSTDRLRPAEHGQLDEHRPAPPSDRLASQRIHHVRQPLDEGTQVVDPVEAAALLVGELRVEAVPARLTLLADEIINRPLVGLRYPAAGENFPCDDRLGVAPGDILVRQA